MLPRGNQMSTSTSDHTQRKCLTSVKNVANHLLNVGT